VQCILDLEAGLPLPLRVATFYRQLSRALSAVNESPLCRFRLISFFFSFPRNVSQTLTLIAPPHVCEPELLACFLSRESAKRHILNAESVEGVSEFP
jgi:hypothetical protein